MDDFCCEKFSIRYSRRGVEKTVNVKMSEECQLRGGAKFAGLDYLPYGGNGEMTRRVMQRVTKSARERMILRLIGARLIELGVKWSIGERVMTKTSAFL